MFFCLWFYLFPGSPTGEAGGAGRVGVAAASASEPLRSRPAQRGGGGRWLFGQRRSENRLQSPFYLRRQYKGVQGFVLVSQLTPGFGVQVSVRQ